MFVDSVCSTATKCKCLIESVAHYINVLSSQAILIFRQNTAAEGLCAALSSTAQHDTLLFSCCLHVQVALQESKARKALGALLSQLSELPETHFNLWWHSVPKPPNFPALQESHAHPQHTSALAWWLSQCCGALQGAQLPQFDHTCSDPIKELLQWVIAAVNISRQHQQQQEQPDAGASTRQQRQHPDKGADTEAKQRQPPQQPLQPPPQEQQQQQQHHPAEVLRQVLDVVLSALLFRHDLSMHQ